MGTLGDVPDSEYLGPGTHIVHVSKVGGYKTDINGKPVKPFFTVFMRNRDDQKIRDRLFLTEAAAFRIKMFASAQGWDVDTVPNPCEGDSQNFPFHHFENDTEFQIEAVADGRFVNVDLYEPLDRTVPKRAWPGWQPPAPLDAEPEPPKEPAPGWVQPTSETPPETEPEPEAADNGTDDDLPF
jgi:hypothetical protein